MMTWLWWQKLRYPNRHHPAFKRIIQQTTQRRNWVMPIALALMTLLALFIFIVTPQSILFVIVISVAVMPILFLLFNGTLLGTSNSFLSSGELAQWRQSGIAPLLYVTPLGWFGIAWIITTAVVHRHDNLRQVYSVVKNLTLIIVTGLGLLIAFLLVTIANTPIQSDTVRLYDLLASIVPIMTVTLLLFFDHVQSLILASLVSLVIAEWFSSRLETPITSATAFIIMQAFTYLVFILAGVGLTVMMRLLVTNSYLERILTSLFFLLIAFTIREGIIYAMTRLLWSRYDLSAREGLMWLQGK